MHFGREPTRNKLEMIYVIETTRLAFQGGNLVKKTPLPGDGLNHRKRRGAQGFIDSLREVREEDESSPARLQRDFEVCVGLRTSVASKRKSRESCHLLMLGSIRTGRNIDEKTSDSTDREHDPKGSEVLH
jgi:hypothetical protein